jgi:DNA-binding NarL/FixJ family response regulator
MLQPIPTDPTDPTDPADHAPTQLLVVDDHELVLVGLSALLSASEQGIKVLQAHTLAQALDLYGAHGQSIVLVLLDLQLPDAHGLSGLRDFLRRFADAPLAVLSSNTDPGLMRQAVAEGALAYFSKSGQFAEVADLVRKLNLRHHQRAMLPLDPALDDLPVTMVQGRLLRTSTGRGVRLAKRQAELLDDILSGKSNREIAERLALSEGTVKNKVSALLLLFAVRSRAQLISLLR